MHIFREELKSTKASHKKLKERLRTLRRYIILHYVLLGLSGINSAFVLFVVINVDVPYREVMFVVACASLVVAVYLLYSGLSK